MREQGLSQQAAAVAPFTLASYLVEGGPSRTWAKTKALMLGEPELWAKLNRRAEESGTSVDAVLAEALRDYLKREE